MSAFILTWSDHYHSNTYDSDLGLEIVTSSGKSVHEWWSTGARKSGIVPGDRCFLLRQGTFAGIMAAGYASSEIYQRPHWDLGPRKLVNAVDVEWHVWLTIRSMLWRDALHKLLPKVNWNTQTSGIRVEQSLVGVLEGIWTEHLRTRPFRSPDEEWAEFGGGETADIGVNRFERDREARAACLTHKGTRCAVCRLDFEERYGDIGRSYIEVHHRFSAFDVDEDYVLDPVRDLDPVCPNCHAMLHRTRPAMSVSALRRRLRRSGYAQAAGV